MHLYKYMKVYLQTTVICKYVLYCILDVMMIGLFYYLQFCK